MRTVDRSQGDDGGTAGESSGDSLRSMDRRQFVGALGVAVTAGFAGCSGGGGGSSGPPIERPDSHAQDMAMTISEDGTEVVRQEVHLELDDPDFVMEFQTMGTTSGYPVFNGRFIKADGSMYMQFGGSFCQEYGESESNVRSMAATPERFGSNGALEQDGTETIDDTEVEVWEADVDDVPLDQFSFSPQGQMGGGGMGGQLPDSGQDVEQPAYFEADNVEEGTLSLWIGAEDRYLYQAEQTATYSSGDGTFGFEMTAENYDFGADFDIQAPSNCGSFGSGSDDGFGDGGFGG